MGDAVTNGDVPSSQFLSHLTSYPVVSDGITYYKTNPYGKKSLEFADSGYNTFAKPYLPYLSKPYSFVAPYLAKADSLGDKGLSKVDETFPVVKTETQQIKTTVFDYAHWPFKVVGEGKDYVLGTYSSEYKKCGGDGYVAGGKALISTSLVISSDTLSWLGNFFTQKKSEAKELYEKKAAEAKEQYEKQTSS